MFDDRNAADALQNEPTPTRTITGGALIGTSEPFLPAAPEAELAVLGAILLDNSAYISVRSLLSPADFALKSHQQIYACIKNLAESGQPVDSCTLCEELRRMKQLDAIGGFSYVAQLTDNLPQAKNIKSYAERVIRAADLRKAVRKMDAMLQRATEPDAILKDFEMGVTELLELVRTDKGSFSEIRKLDDIPDVFSLKDQNATYIVPDIIPRGSLILVTGEPGVGKSYLLLALAVACCSGSEFLGRQCERVPCLILDRENSLSMVQSRLGLLAGVALPGLHVWGGWDPHPVPMVGDPRLLAWAGTERPLIAFDSFVRFHEADENSASDMRTVMANLRRLADAGATVLVLHHKPKGEGASKYRGSSDIFAAVDMAYSLDRERQSGLLRLNRFKSRFSDETTIAIRPDFVEGKFEGANNPVGTRLETELDQLFAIIRESPGSSQRQIVKRAQMPEHRARQLPNSNPRKYWRVELGQRRSVQYFPVEDCCSVASGDKSHSQR